MSSLTSTSDGQIAGGRPRPTFQALCGEDRFFMQESLIRENISIAFRAYDYFLEKWWRISYDTDQIEETTAENDLREKVGNLWVHFNHLICTKGEWMFEYSPFDDITGSEIELTDDIRSLTRRYEDLRPHITGALAPALYVVGDWDLVFKRITPGVETYHLRNEIAALVALRGHPNVAQLLNVITDAKERVMGFTVPLYFGGTLDDRTHLQVTWYIQLMRLVDDLEFKVQHDIFHRDNAGRNILVNSENKIQLIDWDYAASRRTHSGLFWPLKSGPNRDYGDAEAASVICSAFEGATGQTYTRKTDEGHLEAGELFWRRAQKLVCADWNAFSGRYLDVPKNELRDVLKDWWVARNASDYSWSTLVKTFLGSHSDCSPNLRAAIEAR